MTDAAGNSTGLDVIAVTIAEPHTVRVLARDRSERAAEAVIKMAVYRRGVDVEFYDTAPLGKYQDGDQWQPVDA